MYTKSVMCNFCGKSEHQVVHLITSETATICDECITKNIQLINKDAYAFLPAEDVLGLTMGEMLRIDHHNCFNLQSFVDSISLQNWEEKGLFDFLVLLGGCINRARKRADAVESEKIDQQKEKLDKIEAHLKTLVPPKVPS